MTTRLTHSNEVGITLILLDDIKLYIHSDNPDMTLVYADGTKEQVTLYDHVAIWLILADIDDNGTDVDRAMTPEEEAEWGANQ